MLDSRKWKAILLLATLYGIAIGLKFILILRNTPIQLISSFDETVKWAMLGLGGAISSYIFAVSKEKQYSKNNYIQQYKKPIINENEKTDRISHNTTIRTVAVTDEELKKNE